MYHYVLLIGVIVGAFAYHKARLALGHLFVKEMGVQAEVCATAPIALGTARNDEAQVERLQEEVTVLNMMIQEYKKNVDKLGATIMHLEEDLLQSQEVIDSKDQIVANLKGGVADKIASLEDQLAAKDAVIEDLKEDLAAAAAPEDVYNADVIVELQREAAKLRDAKAAADAEVASLTAELAAARSGMQARDTANMELLKVMTAPSGCGDDTAALEAAQARVAELEEELGTAQQRIADGEATKMRLLEVLAQREREAAAASNSEGEALASAQAAMAAKNRCITDLQRTVQEQSAKLAQHMHAMDNTAAALASAQKEVAERDQRIAMLMHSVQQQHTQPAPATPPQPHYPAEAPAVAPHDAHSPDRKLIVSAAEDKIAAMKRRLAMAQARRV